MKIEPTYVTFEQAKLLKEKGFDVDTEHHYNIDGEQYKPVFTSTDISAPEQWQVVEWLRINYDIWITCGRDEDNYKCEVYTIKSGNKHVPTGLKSFPSPQEAYSAAFDYILKHLI